MRNGNQTQTRVRHTEDHFENEYHVSWYIIVYKFSFGLAEFVLGLGIIFFGHHILQLYHSFASQELSEDPHDLLVTITSGILPNLLTHDTFLVFYLLLLGFVKIAGSVGLIYKQNWGADVLVVLTFLLFPFQVIHLLMHPNMFDLLYILVGLVIALYLIEFKPRAWISRLVHRLA